MAQLAPWLEQHFGMTLSLDLADGRDTRRAKHRDARDLSLQLLAGVKTGGLIALSILVNVALIPVVMFYLLRDWNDDRRALRRPACRGAGDDQLRQIVRDIDSVLAEFLRGQVLVMVVLALYYAIALSLARTRSRAGRSASSPGCWCSFPMSASASAWCSASSRRCCSGRAGRLPRRARGVRRRPAARELRAGPVSRRRSHRPASAGGDLRAARVRAAVRLRRRAARAAGVGGAAGRAAPPARRLLSPVYRGDSTR